MPRNGLTGYWDRQGFLDAPPLDKKLNNFKTVQAMTTKQKFLWEHLSFEQDF